MLSKLGNFFSFGDFSNQEMNLNEDIRRCVRIDDVFSSSSDDESSDDEAARSFILRHQERIDIIKEDELYVNAVSLITRSVCRNDHHRVKNYITEVTTRYLDSDFLMHFRFPRSKVGELITRFESTPAYQKILNSPGREKMSATKHILAYLWFAGHQSVEFRDVADRFDMTISSLSSIITRINAFLISLSPIVIRFPNTDMEKKTIRDGFVERTGTKLVDVMGAIDGSHIPIDKPKDDPISYLNRKKFYSIQMQAVCDHKSKFKHVLVGYPGSVHDARVFKESPIPEKLDTFCEVGTYILGDSAYPLRSDLMTPYKDNHHLSVEQHSFNAELSKARILIEHAFGQLKQRFRQLYCLKLRHLTRRIEFIHALCVLHNLGNRNDLDALEPPLEDTNVNEMVEEVELYERDMTAEGFRTSLCNDVARRTPVNVMQQRANAAILQRM